MPLFPTTSDWVAPQVFPNLSTAKIMAVDTETRDSNLERYGPGWARRDGQIVGFAIAVDGWRGYFPVAHEGGGNLDKDLVYRWVRDVLKLPCPKVFHNAAYDLGWLGTEGFEVRGTVHDTMLAAPLLDEDRYSYSLNSLGYDWLKRGKSEEGLRHAAADFGLDAKKELWRLPAMFVGQYGEDDAALTLDLWRHCEVAMAQNDVESIYRLEQRVLPALVAMTRRGVRFDRSRCEKLVGDLKRREQELHREIHRLTGVKVDIWAAASVAIAFDRVGVTYGRTETGQPSFTKAWLDECGHPLAKMIVEAREVQKTYSTFLESYLGFSAKDGRVHTHFNQLRNDEGGTVSGRLSASNPNLQQVPARHEIIGPMVRGLFLPEDGQQWGSIDFSSQEPRLLVHYAGLLGLPGAQRMVDAYCENPRMDFHQMVADLAGIKRKAAKTIGLGLMYGMGKAKLAASLGLSVDEAVELIDTFHERVPFLRGTVERVMNRVDHPASGGAIRTLLGRKCRFPLWEPTKWGSNKPLPHEQAVVAYGPSIKRSGTYKGLNRLIQGSAADQCKAGIAALHEAGETLLLQVHDEVVVSVDDRAHGERCAQIMSDAVKLLVPSVCDVEIGENWGSAK
jgi:DNA polymerase I-like protein with 3'-5' exonuclease and polymerase domains